MNTRVTSIIEQARKLTAEEREELVLRLQHEVGGVEPDGTPEEIEAAWDEEAKLRAAEVNQGKVELVPWEQVLAELRK